MAEMMWGNCRYAIAAKRQRDDKVVAVTFLTSNNSVVPPIIHKATRFFLRPLGSNAWILIAAIWPPVLLFNPSYCIAITYQV